MTKNVYFHDNVMFILKTSPGLTVSVLVLVYSFSLRSLVWRTISSVSQRLTGTCPLVFRGIYLKYVIRGLDCDKTVCDCAFWDVQDYLPKSTVSQQISYEIGVHTQTALYRIVLYRVCSVFVKKAFFLTF